MSSNQKIVIEFDINGNPTLEGFNFVGPECKQFTKALEDDLGVVTETVAKPEMHRQVTARTVARKVVR